MATCHSFIYQQALRIKNPHHLVRKHKPFLIFHIFLFKKNPNDLTFMEKITVLTGKQTIAMINSS